MVAPRKPPSPPARRERQLLASRRWRRGVPDCSRPWCTTRVYRAALPARPHLRAQAVHATSRRDRCLTPDRIRSGDLYSSLASRNRDHSHNVSRIEPKSISNGITEWRTSWARRSRSAIHDHKPKLFEVNNLNKNLRSLRLVGQSLLGPIQSHDTVTPLGAYDAILYVNTLTPSPPAGKP